MMSRVIEVCGRRIVRCWWEERRALLACGDACVYFASVVILRFVYIWPRLFPSRIMY